MRDKMKMKKMRFKIKRIRRGRDTDEEYYCWVVQL